MAVVVRRGIYLDLDKTKLLPGELCITTDTGQCFFCYAPGNVKELATKKDLQEILTESPEAYNALQKLLEDLENNKDELTNILNDILSLKENKLDVTGDSCNNTVTFEEANNDEDIVSGETHAKIFGKILKSFKALRQGKINTTNIVQTDAVNEQTKVPSSAVTYAHGQLISQLQSNITALNNNLAIQDGTSAIIANSGYTFHSAETRLVKIADIVLLNIVIIADSFLPATNTTVATLPDGFRPIRPMNLIAKGSTEQWGGTFGILHVYIGSNGSIQLRQLSGSNFKYAMLQTAFSVK